MLSSNFLKDAKLRKGVRRVSIVACTALFCIPILMGIQCPQTCAMTDCDDNDACTTDTCDESSGTPVCSNDATTCPANQTCDPADGVCKATACTDDAGCDDDDACNGAETCVATVCTAGTAVDCSDGDLCTTDVCDSTDGSCTNPAVVCTAPETCDPTTGACGGDCTDNADCDDTDVCTQDTCDAGTCNFAALQCDQGESCNPTTGNCEVVDCTSTADCDDGFACTADACNLTTGVCSYTDIDALCDNGLFCDGEGVVDEFCDPADANAEADGCVRAGNPCPGISVLTPICVEATDGCVACVDAADCDDDINCTDDVCELDGSCTNTPNPNNCPDPDFCDGVDTCIPGDPDEDADGCVAPGQPCLLQACNEVTNLCFACTGNPDCNDGILCTTDTCDGGTGDCANVNDNTKCPQSLFCDGADTCDPTDINADANGCFTDYVFPCPGAGPVDLGACNEANDTCFHCMADVECDDGLDCTDDTCNGLTGLCTFTDTCLGLDSCAGGVDPTICD